MRWEKPRPSAPSTLAAGTRTWSKNSSAVSCDFWPIFSRLRPRVNPGMSRSTTSSEKPRWPAVGSVRVTTMTRSALIPEEMKVLDPDKIQSSPSRSAWVRTPARSLPAPGSLMAMAPIRSPAANPGSQRCCCSGLASEVRYGATMSLCSVNAGVPGPAVASSSATTALNRKSASPPPPNCSGTLNPITPCLPAAWYTARSTIPASSQAWACGATSRARNSRTTSRNCSCSGSKTVRRIVRSEQLEHGGVGLAAALAHGLQPVPDAVVTHVVHQRGHQPGAAATERVTERDRAAVGVQHLGVGTGLGQPGQRDRGERLVDLEGADLVDGQAAALQGLGRGVYRRGQHDHRVRGGQHGGVDAGQRGQPQLGRLGAGHDEQRGRAVADLRAVARGDHAVRLEGRLQVAHALQRAAAPDAFVLTDLGAVGG